MTNNVVVLGLASQCLGCQAVGVPEPGYDFYMCEACLDKLAHRFDAQCKAILRAMEAPCGGVQ